MIDNVLGKLVADKYRIESLISESESGNFYLARHEVLDRPVTVKLLPAAMEGDTRQVRQFVDEARAASGISHPNILSLTDFGTDAKGISYAVFEEIKGLTLNDILAITPQLDEKRALNISQQIGQAVAAAHARKVLHGYLSPQFVYINSDADGSADVKVFGFGGDPMHVAADADP